MSARTATWFAWSLVVLSVVLLGGGIWLALVTTTTVPELPYGGVSEPGNAVLTLATDLTFSVVGAIIASRHPRNTIGWLFCGVGLGWGLSTLAGATPSTGSKVGQAQGASARRRPGSPRGRGSRPV
jgi:hypothetical protein